MAAHDLFVPVLPTSSLPRLKLLFETVQGLEEDLEHVLDHIFIVINAYNATYKIAKEAKEALTKHYPEFLLKQVIRQCTKFAQASSEGIPIFAMMRRARVHRTSRPCWTNAARVGAPVRLKAWRAHEARLRRERTEGPARVRLASFGRAGRRGAAGGGRESISAAPITDVRRSAKPLPLPDADRGRDPGARPDRRPRNRARACTAGAYPVARPGRRSPRSPISRASSPRTSPGGRDECAPEVRPGRGARRSPLRRKVRANSARLRPPRRRPGQARRRAARSPRRHRASRSERTAPWRRSPGSPASCARRKPGWRPPPEAQAARAEIGRAREASSASRGAPCPRGRTRRSAQDLLAARSERERLAEELLAAHADVGRGGAKPERAEEIHKALAEAGADVRNSLKILTTSCSSACGRRRGCLQTYTRDIRACVLSSRHLDSTPVRIQLVHRTEHWRAPSTGPLIFW